MGITPGSSIQGSLQYFYIPILQNLYNFEKYKVWKEPSISAYFSSPRLNTTTYKTHRYINILPDVTIRNSTIILMPRNFIWYIETSYRKISCT